MAVVNDEGLLALVHFAVCEADRAKAALATERAARTVVQRALLPASIPKVPGLEIAFDYRPVADAAEIGGDWYDAFHLPDGTLAVTVGDVAGHDLRAAIEMGQARNAMRAYAVEHAKPGVVLERVNNLMMALPDPDLVTAIFGVFDPDSYEVTFARAGHQPPVARLLGQVVELAEPRGIALGILANPEEYTEATVVLAPGDSVMFYTDGLVERRGCDTAMAIERLMAVLENVPNTASAHSIVDMVMEQCDVAGTAEDDVCLLVLHRPVD